MKLSKITLLGTLYLALGAGCTSEQVAPDSRPNPIKREPFESTLERAPQKFERTGNRESDRNALYHYATEAMSLGAYAEAAIHWKEYVDSYPATSEYEEAQFQYALSLSRLHRAEEGIQVLRPLLESNSSPKMFVEGRLIYAELLIESKRFDEAVATTYDVLPNPDAEKKSGIRRVVKATVATQDQQVRLLTLRGRIFAELARGSEAMKALSLAKAKLKPEQKELLAHVNWREIQTRAAICRNASTKPEQLSEAEFIELSDAYYACTADLPKLYCGIIGTDRKDIMRVAMQDYKSAALYPLSLTNPLPPPSRRVKESQKSFYESEMKTLAERTVRERSGAFRNLEQCKVYDVFEY